MTDGFVEILSIARELLARENGWCQEAYAVAPDGQSVWQPRQWNDSCQFCSLGAIEYSVKKTLPDLHPEEYHEINKRIELHVRDAIEEVSELVELEGICTIADTNDHPTMTQAKIVEIFDRAIDLAKEKE